MSLSKDLDVQIDSKFWAWDWDSLEIHWLIKKPHHLFFCTFQLKTFSGAVIEHPTAPDFYPFVELFFLFMLFAAFLFLPPIITSSSSKFAGIWLAIASINYIPHQLVKRLLATSQALSTDFGAYIPSILPLQISNPCQIWFHVHWINFSETPSKTELSW